MRDQAFLTFFSLLPKHAISRAVGGATRVAGLKAAHQTAIRAFARQYDVAVEEAEKPLDQYESFGEFFTRRLRPGIRPIAPGEAVPVSPVDGAISQAGVAEKGRLLQAKGRDYSLAALLGDEGEARRFEGGAYATIYLSPRDYHRIHAPIGGRILGWSYIPGQLWPVNRPSVRNVHELFAVNERVVVWMESPLGRVAVVAVGATCVGRIRLSFDSIVSNDFRPAQKVRYDEPLPIEKGAELGVFEMGSTVILCFEPGRAELDARLVPDAEVQLGEPIGRAIGEGAAT